MYVIREGPIAVHRRGENESSEEMTRCAALSRFGVDVDEIDAREAPPRCMAIYLNDNFEVSPTA